MAPPSQAQIILAKAQKKYASQPGWFASSGSKWEEAGDMFQQAANQFKIEKLFKDAGDAFAKEADCREQAKETSDAANAWWNAAKAYKQGYPDLAIRALQSTITHLCAGGRFRQAADREKEIGQIYLQESNNLAKACESFIRAGEWYEQEDGKATANACYKDAADLHAELDEFPQAIALYEKVADHSLTSALTKYSVKEYWLRAGLCALANNDAVTAKRKVMSYSNKDTTFASTREAKLLNSVIEAMEAGDQEKFTETLVDYDSVSKLDNWKTAILLKIKKLIQDDDEGGIL